MRHALSDIRVVELALDWAGTYCGKLFADLGADVVKVVPPPSGVTEAGDDAVAHLAAHLHLNTNKRLTAQDAAADVARLLDGADLVVESQGRGSLEGWGLGWDAAHARDPALACVLVSGFGADGPYAAYTAPDIVAEAVSGTLLNTQEGLVRLPGHLGSAFVGSMAALGGLVAVRWARTTGEGRRVDCASVEALASTPIRASTLLGYEYRGRIERELPTGSESLIPVGVFPCGDGFMAMMSTPQQLQEMLDVLDDDELRAAFARPDAWDRGETKEAIDAALYPWLLSHTRAECTAAAQARGWPLAGVNSPREVLDADHLHQRGFWVRVNDPRAGALDMPGPPYRFAEGGWALRSLAAAPGPVAAMPARERCTPADASAALPLEGVRIVDLTTVWSGPYAALLLADLGAEVIRVENPWVLPPTTKGYEPRPSLADPGILASMYAPPDPARPDRPWNRHAMNNAIARNKLSVALDTRHPEGHELFMRLVERSDVVLENFKSNGLDRLGLWVSEMQQRNPRVIIVRMPPTGLTGDWAGYTGFGAQFDALTGMSWICGLPDADPMSTPATTYMDAATGPAAGLAVVAALNYREHTGRGQLIEFAQSENVLNHLGEVFVAEQLGLSTPKMGNRDRARAPQGLYPCLGGTVLAISVGSDDEWAALLGVIGAGSLRDDPRVATLEGRRAHHDEIDKVVSAWAGEQDAYAAFHLLQAAGVPAGPFLNDTMFFGDPHLTARGFLRPLTTTDVGSHMHAGHAYRGVPQAWRRGSPALGEDNEYVFKTVIGVTDADYERYRRDLITAED
ncbi:MAG TPA: CoA transferase, partial [Acidimicrobiales bacterium]|nr:CoA transferase [Acidimicrobiales bacterium]